MNDVVQRENFKAGVDYEITRIEPPGGVKKALTDLRSLEERILETLFAGECCSKAARTAHTHATGLIKRHAAKCNVSDADMKPLRETVSDFKSRLYSGVHLRGGWYYRDLFMLREGLMELGVTQLLGEGEWFHPYSSVCPYFDITARVRDPRGDAWGLAISFADGDGVSKELSLTPADINGPTAAFGVKLREGGLCCMPKRVTQVIDYLTGVEPTIVERRRIVERGGWHTIDSRAVFVTPHETIGYTGGERVALEGDGFSGFAASGTLDEWHEHVAKPAGAHRLLRLAMATVVSESLLTVINHQSGGIHLKGNSSLGKTTALSRSRLLYGEKATRAAGLSHSGTRRPTLWRASQRCCRTQRSFSMKCHRPRRRT